MDPSHHVNRQTFVYNLFFFFATAFGIMADRDVVDLEAAIVIDDGPAAGSASTQTAPSSTNSSTGTAVPASPAVPAPGFGIK